MLLCTVCTSKVTLLLFPPSWELFTCPDFFLLFSTTTKSLKLQVCYPAAVWSRIQTQGKKKTLDIGYLQINLYFLTVLKISFLLIFFIQIHCGLQSFPSEAQSQQVSLKGICVLTSKRSSHADILHNFPKHSRVLICCKRASKIMHETTKPPCKSLSSSKGNSPSQNWYQVLILPSLQHTTELLSLAVSFPVTTAILFSYLCCTEEWY